MRILKYILLWLVLLLVTISVFVYTQPDRISFKIEKRVPIQKEWVALYIQKLKYWPVHSNNIVNDEDSTHLNFDFIIQNDHFVGSFQKINLDEIDTLKLNTNINSIEADVVLSLNEKSNQTTMNWNFHCDLNYFEKLITMIGFYNPEKIAHKFVDFYAQELSQKIYSDFNFNSHETEGVIKLAPYFVVSKDTICRKSEIESNKILFIKELEKTIDTLQVQKQGKPILSYFKIENGLYQTEVQIKIEPNEKILLYPELFKEIEEQNVLKIVFVGDTKKNQNTDQIIKKELNIHDLTPNPRFEIMVIERINASETGMPFEWVTEFYIPVLKKQVIETPNPSENFSTENSNE